MTRRNNLASVPSIARTRRMGHWSLVIGCWLLLLATVISLPSQAAAQEAPPPNKPTLANDQDAIRARYKRFNLTLQQMAEILRKQDPERADLLFRALGKSQETRVEDQMNLIFTLLNKEQPQLGEALERQEELLATMKTLLELLQSENRLSEIEKEKQRLQELVKDLNKLIGKEKDLRVGTERGEEAGKLADKQAEIEKQADSLGKKIDKQDAERSGEPSNGGQPAKEKPPEESNKSDEPSEKKADKPSGDKKPMDDKQPSDSQKPNGDKPPKKSEKSDSPKEGSKSDSSKQPMPSGSQKGSEQKPAEKDQPGKPQEGKPQDQPMNEGKSAEKEPQDSSPQSQPKDQQKTPGRKELEQSREAMQRAIDELKKKNRDGASKEQDDAVAKLMEAKEKIEEILRQLREEEQKLMLAALEARFKKMLAMQLVIYHDTVRLSKAGESEKSAVQARAVKLSQDEQEIAVEADKALVLLKEEGSSIAFPEAVSGIRHDLVTLVGWLRDAEVGELTQAVEKDVIEALEELVEALQKEMEKSDEEKKQQQQQQQQNDDDSQPLVDQLSELKMLRNLQLRVNRRTKVLGRQFEGEQASEGKLVDQLRDLSGRQARIQQATADLVKEKNK